MPDFINKVSYINTAGNEIELDQTTAVTTVDENTLSVSHADTADTADLAIVANSATNIKNKAGSNVPLASALLDMVYPIGSIYMSVSNVSPQSFLGGTWVAWGSGRVPVGVDTGQTDFATVEQTGGEVTHTLTIREMPSHNHSLYAAPSDSGGRVPVINYSSGTGIGSAQLQPQPGSTGQDEAHNNLQPYITCYMWKRTA